MARLLREATTFLTNIPLILIGVLWGSGIWEKYGESFHPFHFNLGMAFYTLAAGAIGGAVFHGFRHHFPEVLHQRIWKVALMGIGLTLFFNLLAALSAVTSPENYRLWQWTAVAGLIIFGWQTVKFEGFGHSLKFLSVGLIVELFAFGLFAWRQPEAGPFFLFLGSAVIIGTGGLWVTGWSPHQKFNHNDLFHVIQLPGLWLLYRGALLTTTVQLP
tara:strand:+ start:3284 stop:3931 length:648 start_codon:yes stop_codon:yes gene_type:complete